MRKVIRLGLAGGTALAALAGCASNGLAALPLPGGAPDGPGYRVVIEFADVLDLVPQASVKVNDVTVGSVEKIWLSGWTARVRVRVDRKVRLPDNATAAVRQTSLFGEKFVALAAPQDEPGRGELSDNDVIPLARTRRAAEVEEVLSALGLVLNGSGIANLKTINEELAGALHGREADAKAALRQLDEFIGRLDEQKADIVRAIDAMDKLSARLAAQRETIGKAVDALGPGLRTLAEQREQLTAALTALGKLGKVGTRVINASRDDTLASIAALRPILDQLVKAGDSLPKSLDFLLSYPFPPNVIDTIHGDSVNLHITADLDATSVLANLLSAAPEVAKPAKPSGSLLPPLLPSLPPLLPSLPPLLPGSSSESQPGLQLPLDGLPILPGSAPAGAAEGQQGGLYELLSWGLPQ